MIQGVKSEILISVEEMTMTIKKEFAGWYEGTKEDGTKVVIEKNDENGTWNLNIGDEWIGAYETLRAAKAAISEQEVA